MKKLFVILICSIVLLQSAYVSTAQSNLKVDSSRIVKVLTFNIYHGEKYYRDRDKPFENNLDAVAKVVNELQPDLVAMQEVDFKTKRGEIINQITDKQNGFLNEGIDKSFKKIIALQKRLIKYQDYLFLFLKDRLVPPDNNGSERAIRNFTVKQKISGFFKTNKGAANYALLRSVCNTAIKNNQNSLIPFKLAAHLE